MCHHFRRIGIFVLPFFYVQTNDLIFIKYDVSTRHLTSQIFSDLPLSAIIMCNTYPFLIRILQSVANVFRITRVYFITVIKIYWF